MTTTVARIAWSPVIEHALQIVRSYGIGVTLRQLFYRLVSAGLIPNTIGAYKTLSSRTAAARRDGEFPALVDNTRSIVRPQCWTTPTEAFRAIVAAYRRDRMEGQAFNVFLGVEKHALGGLLESWFEELGVSIVALGGYASQTLADDVRGEIEADGRPAVLIYAGDFDASGVDILRDFEERVGAFDEAVQVALTAEQVEQYKLPPQPGKSGDARAGRFVARHGRLVQVEVDALPPDTLRALYEAAIWQYADSFAWQDVVDKETVERRAMAADLRLIGR